MACPSQHGFQHAVSPVTEELLCFHDHMLIIIFLISSLVICIVSLVLTTKLTHTGTINAQEVEKMFCTVEQFLLSATPGCVKQAALDYGQCAKICGSNHSFMTVVLESVPLKYFEK
ncbi:hypothetical protein Celaphus_00016046 [Cervus elaphus hippelaphus]|uniref:Cytochrome c oxidase subunit 2 n=1 Tax=Cervus elaphus hippelaphus TaxID=46360 RepID=A0A212C224_CEREH|nr:hypothetical protein Celaphus_00016046 [Cervus elaphus hippelaphus]